MIKKIIIGIIIATIFSLCAAGFIYAYQKEQSGLNAAVLAADDKNDSAVSSAENKYQYSNTYGKTEKNGNCESENNCYSWQHKHNLINKNCDEDNCFKYNYRYQNSNVECESSFFDDQPRTSDKNECKNIRNDKR